MNKKKSSIIKVSVGIAAVILIVLIILVSNSVAKKKEAEALSRREIYSSEFEMQTAMQGKWTHYTDDYGLGRSPLWQYVIKDDLAYMVFDSEDKLDYGYQITWSPSDGTFTIGGTKMIVSKGGRSFTEDSSLQEVYEKGGYLSSSSSGQSSNWNSYESSNDTSPAVIFSNLDISDFSASLGNYGGRMQCVVRNNNAFSVFGYFYVNFYSSSGELMYSQLISLPSVTSGGIATCTASIPKSNYPSGYSYVEFSQASLKIDK